MFYTTDETGPRFLLIFEYEFLNSGCQTVRGTGNRSYRRPRVYLTPSPSARELLRRFAALLPSPLPREHLVRRWLHSPCAALLKAAPHTGTVNPSYRRPRVYLTPSPSARPPSEGVAKGLVRPSSERGVPIRSRGRGLLVRPASTRNLLQRLHILLSRSAQQAGSAARDPGGGLGGPRSNKSTWHLLRQPRPGDSKPLVSSVVSLPVTNCKLRTTNYELTECRTPAPPNQTF